MKERSFLPSNFPLLPLLWNGEFDFLHARVSLRQTNSVLSISEGKKEKLYRSDRNVIELASRPNRRIVLEMCQSDGSRSMKIFPSALAF